ncbi:MAG TPA: radical SAM protein [Candidatus Bathyarchaeia archaeon]|nr:radical SAM protein [Candidatus Bathyarchaeia archaeon]
MNSTADQVSLCFESPEDKLGDLLNLGYVKRRTFPDDIHFYTPGMVHYETSFHHASNPFRFPALSVTGRACQLQCEHCKGRLLEKMISTPTPEKFLDECGKIFQNGGKGCLISGGSRIDGSVPLENFLKAIREAKNRYGLDIIVHTGMVHPDTVESLVEAGVDAAMVDVIGSDETYRKIYHLENGVTSLKRVLDTFEDTGMEYIPHIVVGIDDGIIKGEKNAINILSGYNPSALVVVSLMPLEHTSLDKVNPPTPSEISRVLLAARLAFPDKPLMLGCARSNGDARAAVDILAIKAGVNGIAFPSEEGYDYAVRSGLKPIFSEECCSLVYRDIMKLRRS